MSNALLKFANESPAAAIVEQLESFGLNLFALLDSSKLDDCSIPARATSVALIGNFGRRLWDAIPDSGHQRQHPVDDYCVSVVTRVLTNVIGEQGWVILFPDRTSPAVPALQQLGRAAGWHNSSPLGNGIHPEYGLWFAYRAVVAINIDVASGSGDRMFSANATPSADSPCLRCIDQPCIKACPPSALSATTTPDLEACANFRSGDSSACAERCLARQQCPVGVQHQYADAQIRYFYRHSLESLKRWVAEAPHRGGK